MELKITITGKMIRRHLGVDRGYKIKIKRNSKVYRQKNKGEKWQYCGTSASIAFEIAKKHGVEDWELEGHLDFDHLSYTINTFREHGFEKSEDMANFMRMVLNYPFNDIKKEGVVWIVGNRPKEAEEALFYDYAQQDAIMDQLHA